MSVFVLMGSSWPTKPALPNAPNILGLGHMDWWKSHLKSDKAGMETAGKDAPGASVPPEVVLRRKDSPVPFFLPGMSPRGQYVITLDMSHLTGFSLLCVPSHVLLVVFWPF